jgi:hypothetical protein
MECSVTKSAQRNEALDADGPETGNPTFRLGRGKETTMITNRVSSTLSTADQDAVMAAIAVIREKLPFLIDLTNNERVSLSKLGAKRQAFTKMALEVAQQNSVLLPAEFLQEMRKDAQLLDALAPIRVAIDVLQKQIDDTVLQVGAETYAAARTVYTISKTPFAKAAMRDAAGDLSKRAGRRPRIAAPVAEPDPAVPPIHPATTS